jgi:UDP-glucose 4-epimerase
MLQGHQPTIYGDGTKTRDYVFVDDIVKANVDALDHARTGIYNLGWGNEVTDFTIFDTVRRHAGFTTEPLYAPRRLGEVERICLDARRAQSELGWAPTVPLDEGIARAVAFYRTHLHRFVP